MNSFFAAGYGWAMYPSEDGWQCGRYVYSPGRDWVESFYVSRRVLRKHRWEELPPEEWLPKAFELWKQQEGI